MKKIGLVGGTGPESTVMYYKELNSKINEIVAREDILRKEINKIIEDIED